MSCCLMVSFVLGLFWSEFWDDSPPNRAYRRNATHRSLSLCLCFIQFSSAQYPLRVRTSALERSGVHRHVPPYLSSIAPQYIHSQQMQPAPFLSITILHPSPFSNLPQTGTCSFVFGSRCARSLVPEMLPTPALACRRNLFPCTYIRRGARHGGT
jgi:hypothetical protein